MKKIFVTGGLGYIGSHICSDLLNNGYSVFAYDNLYNSDKSVIKKIEKITNKKLSFIKGDVLNKKLLQSSLKRIKPYAVIHLAALKSVSESFKRPTEYYKNNFVGSLNLVECLDQINCNYLIFSSTASIYGKPKYLPIDEKHIENPQNTYSKSKLFSEKLFEDWTKLNSKRKAVSLRYFNVAGACKSGLLKENIKKSDNIFPSFLRSLKFYKPFKIYGYDYNTKDGTVERDYVHVVDLSISHILVLKNINNLNAFEIINLGNKKSYSVLEIVSHLNKFLLKKKKVIFSSRRLGDDPVYIANNKYAHKKLNWQPLLDINDMCENTLNSWFNRFTK
jgi:UDP-glucose 4-epimerase